MKYIAKMQVVHSVLKRTFEPGEIVPLDHLNADQVATLIRMGGVAEYAGDASVSELDTLRGLTPAHAEALAGLGIRTFQDLSDANGDDVVTRIDGVNVKTFGRWQTDARNKLMDRGPQATAA